MLNALQSLAKSNGGGGGGAQSLTGGEVAGLGPGGVAGEEAAEGGGAVALQPRPEQLDPFLQTAHGGSPPPRGRADGRGMVRRMD